MAHKAHRVPGWTFLNESAPTKAQKSLFKFTVDFLAHLKK